MLAHLQSVSIVFEGQGRRSKFNVIGILFPAVTGLGL